MRKIEDPLSVKFTLLSKISSPSDNIKEGLIDLAADARFFEWTQKRKPEAPYQRVYFDSSLVIDLLLGLQTESPQGSLLFKQLKKPSNIILAMSYRNWLGKIYTLGPHQDELVNKISMDTDLFPMEAPKKHQERRERILKEAKLEELLKAGQRNLKNEERYDSESKFLYCYILSYLLKDDGFWMNRYKHLHDQKIFGRELRKYQYALAEITRSPLFDEVLVALNDRRPVLSRNNLNDAIALCLLDRELEGAHDNPDLPIPVFYSEQDSIFGAIKALKKIYLARNTKRGDRIPFHIYDEETEDYFSVVRKDNYFVICGISGNLSTQASETARLKEFRVALSHLYQVIEPLIENTPNHRYAEEIRDLSFMHFSRGFFQRWFQTDAEKELGLLKRDADKDLKRKISDFIDAMQQKWREDAEKHSDPSSFIIKIWDSLDSLEHHVITLSQRQLESGHAIDRGNFVKQELQSRFGFPATACDRIKDDLDEIFLHAKAFVSEADYAKKIPIKHEFLKILGRKKGQICARILGVIFDKDTKRLNEGQIISLGHSVGFLYMLSEYDTIVATLNDFFHNLSGAGIERNQIYRSLILLHLAATIEERKGKLHPQLIEETIGKELQQIDDSQSAKLQLLVGYSYIRYLIWIRRLKRKRRSWMVPEEAQFKLSSQDFSEIYGYLVNGLPHLEEALRSVNELLDEYDDEADEALFVQLSDQRYYIINNLLFFLTYAGKADDFKEKAQELASELRQATPEAENEILQYRYSDTLARYNIRRAILNWSNEEARVDFLQDSRKAIESAIKIADRVNRSLYEILDQEITDLLRQPPQWTKEISPFRGFVAK